MRIIPGECCLAFDGNVTKSPRGSAYYVACAANPHGTSSLSCAVSTHNIKNHLRRLRLALQMVAFFVNYPLSSRATEDKILMGTCLVEQDLPAILPDAGSVDLLLEFKAPPFV